MKCKKQKKDMNSDVVIEFENAVRSIEIQLEITKEEHKNLQEELYQLVEENQKLTNILDAEYQEKIQLAKDDNNVEIFKLEIVSNLLNQLDLCKKEKEKTLELYKTSLTLIEKLEDEISNQRKTLVETGSTKTSVSLPIVAVLEAKLKNAKEHLEMVMNGREHLESENIKHQTEIAKLKLNVDSNNKLIEQLKFREGEWKNKCSKLEQEYTLLNATYECVLNCRNELEKKVENYEIKIQDLVKKNIESRNKVEEALDTIEKALAEKEAAVLREIQLQEEIRKLQMCVEHVVEEAGKKVGFEVEETRKKYESNIKDLLQELSEVKKVLENKTVEHKRLSFKYKKLVKVTSAKLNEEKISLIKGSETEITILENRLDSAYQELERFKVKYEELGNEKTKLEKEFSELIEKYQNLMKDNECREESFREIISKLQSQIEGKIGDLNEAADRSEFFLNQVRELQVENKKLKTLLNNCDCNRLKVKLKKLNEICMSQRSELQSHIESQMKLNEIWKNEVKEITGKFEEKIRELKKKCNHLNAKNKKMISELNTARKKIFSIENLKASQQLVEKK